MNVSPFVFEVDEAIPEYGLAETRLCPSGEKAMET
jgi:hypothetical protein